MEKKKRRILQFTKLRVQCTDEVTKQKIEEEIMKPSEIRYEMRNFYQNREGSNI